MIPFGLIDRARCIESLELRQCAAVILEERYAFGLLRGFGGAPQLNFDRLRLDIGDDCRLRFAQRGASHLLIFEASLAERRIRRIEVRLPPPEIQQGHDQAAQHAGNAGAAIEERRDGAGIDADQT